MSGIDKLISNPLIKKLFLSKLKEIFKDNGLTALVITVDDKGEFNLSTFTEPVATISQEKLNILIQFVKDNSNEQPANS